MNQLTRKGVKKQPAIGTLTVEEELGASLIRWIPETTSLAEQLARYAAYKIENDSASVAPHIICKGAEYIIFIDGEIIPCGVNAIQAIDSCLKALACLV